MMQATEALLSGWIGPVSVSGHEGACAVIDCRDGKALIAYRLTDADRVRETWVDLHFVSLDLTRAECRARVEYLWVKSEG